MRHTDPRSGKTFERVSPYRALIPFLFAHERYLELAIRHNMAINLESRDILKAFQEGTYLKDGWEEELLERAKEAAAGVRRGIWSSFLMMAIALVVAIAIGYHFGKVSPELPLSWPKVFGLLGGFLTAWATLMELGGLMKTYSGETLHELIHPAFFRVLFIPGTLAVMVGLLW
ncbi:hypothetical protein [Nitrosomonas communis]|uniref:hypothetical protein n=1 Tax=Nitrosomonas communis TaxID=44574 RepID=UPI003D2A7CAA